MGHERRSGVIPVWVTCDTRGGGGSSPGARGARGRGPGSGSPGRVRGKEPRTAAEEGDEDARAPPALLSPALGGGAEGQR